MKILVIDEKGRNGKIYKMLDLIIKENKIIETHDISKELSNMQNMQYDLIVIDFDRARIQNGDFKVIFDVRCKTQVPILVILDTCKTRDKLHVLNMKADDYMEKPISVDEFEKKILQLLHKIP